MATGRGLCVSRRRPAGVSGLIFIATTNHIDVHSGLHGTLVRTETSRTYVAEAWDAYLDT
eukprot:362452-Chlamydomonas_euryale.AAC.1